MKAARKKLTKKIFQKRKWKVKKSTEIKVSESQLLLKKLMTIIRKRKVKRKKKMMMTNLVWRKESKNQTFHQ